MAEQNKSDFEARQEHFVHALQEVELFYQRTGKLSYGATIDLIKMLARDRGYDLRDKV